MRKSLRTSLKPDGFAYYENVLSPAEQEAVVRILEQLDYKPYIYEGYVAKRLVHYFGYGYQFYSSEVNLANAFPDWLQLLRDRAVSVANVDGVFEQALVNKYEIGAAIGWHRDAPAFGPVVLGVSLGAPETLRFRRIVENKFEQYRQVLQPGSMYVLAGAARSVWQHSIAPAKALRYSSTFRSVNSKYRVREKAEYPE